MRVILLLMISLAGCCSHVSPPVSRKLPESADVTARLYQQFRQWRGTPYRNGGLSRAGIDCSGFVVITFRDRFNLQLPRNTKAQISIGLRIDQQALIPGDLLFFKIGSGENGLHVGIYYKENQFIHASTSKGVIRSSLNNTYWRNAFWQARRL